MDEAESENGLYHLYYLLSDPFKVFIAHDNDSDSENEEKDFFEERTQLMPLVLTLMTN